MKRSHKIVIGVVLGISVIAVGGAVGATQLTPKQESDAVLNDAADQLGVEPDELSNALKQALKNRVDDAVEDGRLTREQGERMKDRIDAGEMPFFGLGPRVEFHGPGKMFFHDKLDTAAKYLGMTPAQLREALQDGKTLAQVARDRGKSVDGLIDAYVEDAEKRLNEAVEAGRLTKAEKNEMLSGLRERLSDFVNGRFPGPPRMFGPRFHRVEPGAEYRPVF
jgi:hypothetical protein